ncbi:uncharacterized protein A1O5_00833 [Cladophialophora psammophila CBS 110553]|uniref:Clr5 domain-containing protein n=1 Tax=Cladophialophora psammophila CBS 110553 TaxID=1182543 RepID=W9XG40_9EURO|nr:uncharacterized protein A1O5_00833 [Cladophialophora psammophila CBS 110553]EXJ76325.1 hypothetical protein A1O5_00833 [Cladophialophora psammophila CBS 110553]
MVGKPKYPHPASGWQPFQALITRLYREENRPLKEVMQILETQHGFKATEKMYKSRIRAWRLDKKNKRTEVQEILRLRENRKLLGKKSAFILRDRPVDMDDVERYVKRTGLLVQQAEPMSSGSSPLPDLICFTPPPTPHPLSAPASLRNVEWFMHSLEAFVEHSLQSGIWKRGNDIMGLASISSDHAPWLRNEFVMSIERGIQRYNLGHKIQACRQWQRALSSLKHIVRSGNPSQLLKLVELIAYLAGCQDRIAALLLRKLADLVKGHHQASADTRLWMLQNLSRIEAKDVIHLREISYDFSQKAFSSYFSRDAFFLLDTETVLSQTDAPPGLDPAFGSSRLTNLLSEWKTYDAEALRGARSAMEILMALKQYEAAERFALMHIERLQGMAYSDVVAGQFSHTYSYLTHLYLRADNLNLQRAYHFTRMKVENYFEMLMVYRPDIPEDFILPSFALLANLARSLCRDKEAAEWECEYTILRRRTDALTMSELSPFWKQAALGLEDQDGQSDVAWALAPSPSIMLPEIFVEDRRGCQGHKIHGQRDPANAEEQERNINATFKADWGKDSGNSNSGHRRPRMAATPTNDTLTTSTSSDHIRDQFESTNMPMRMDCSSDGDLSRWHEHTCYHQPTR